MEPVTAGRPSPERNPLRRLLILQPGPPRLAFALRVFIEGQGHLQSGQWRAQFVTGVGQQDLGALHQLLDARRLFLQALRHRLQAGVNRGEPVKPLKLFLQSNNYLSAVFVALAVDSVLDLPTLLSLYGP